MTGCVGNTAEKQIAADIAAASEGVREINNLLIVNADQVQSNVEHYITILSAISQIIGVETKY